MRRFCGEHGLGRGVQADSGCAAINLGVNAMASGTPMGKQGDEFGPAPGIRGWWIIYPDIFLHDGDSRNLMLFESDSTTRCWGFSAQELAKQFGMNAGLLLLNNQIGALTVRVENMPTIGTTKRVLHTFEIPMHSPVRMIVNIGRPTGRTGYGL
jgi:hypothetical protein